MIRTEITRILNATRYSIDGVKAAWRDAGAFRLEAVATVPVILLAFVLADTFGDAAILIAAWLLIPLVELLNTGIEATVDLVTKGERHPLAKKAKDTGSAAVGVACFVCILVWIGILWA